MSREATDLLEQALKLPRKARAALVNSLIESLDEAVDDDAEAAWQHEIARRLQELDSGEAKSIPWSQVRLQLLDG